MSVEGKIENKNLYFDELQDSLPGLNAELNRLKRRHEELRCPDADANGANLHELRYDCQLAVTKLQRKIERIEEKEEEIEYFLKVGRFILDADQAAQQGDAQGGVASQGPSSSSDGAQTRINMYIPNEKLTKPLQRPKKLIGTGGGDLANNSTLDSFIKVGSHSSSGKVYQQYLEDVEDKPNLQRVNVETCEQCTGKIYLIHDKKNGVYVCPECGHTLTLGDFDVTQYMYDFSTKHVHFPYKRINHFNEWLSQLQAKESTEIPSDVIDEVLKECKKNHVTDRSKVNHKLVRRYLKKLGLQRWYENSMQIACTISNRAPPHIDDKVERQLRNMFWQIQEPFERHKPGNRQNFPSYPYVLYKMLELLGHDHLLQHFSLLKSREKLWEHDVLWKRICNDLNWQWIRTV